MPYNSHGIYEPVGPAESDWEEADMMEDEIRLERARKHNTVKIGRHYAVIKRDGEVFLNSVVKDHAVRFVRIAKAAQGLDEFLVIEIAVYYSGLDAPVPVGTVPHIADAEDWLAEATYDPREDVEAAVDELVTEYEDPLWKEVSDGVQK